MSRPRLALILIVLVAAAAAGCRRGGPRTVAHQASLQLALPDSPGSAGRLLVNGQEVAVPAAGEPLLVTPPEGATRLEVSYHFWPDAHTRVVRHRTVALARGETIPVSFLKEDDKSPDRLFPQALETPPDVLAAMARLAKIGKDDLVYDIGAGGGQVALAAVTKLGARKAVALEYDDDLVAKAEANVKAAGAGDKVQVLDENVLERTDFSEADVIILSWTTPTNARILAHLRTGLRHGTRIVSCRSALGDWKPDETRVVKARGADGHEAEHTLRLWTIRAPEVPNLHLALPYSAPPPSYDRDRVSALLIDGKDLSEPRVSHRALAIKPKAGADSARVVYTFWPNTYTKITRTWVVKLAKDGPTRADLTKANPSAPDQIRPIYVPTPEEVVDEMCKLAKVTKDDIVYDIGCGDGRLVIRSARAFGAKKGIGIDINPELVKLCQDNARKAGVSDRVTFEAKDAQKIDDFSEATVVFIYLGDYLNLALRPTLQKTLKPGTRLVSHRFLMGDWKPDVTRKIRAKDNNGEDEDFELHLWTIK